MAKLITKEINAISVDWRYNLSIITIHPVLVSLTGLHAVLRYYYGDKLSVE